jgi:hypothetical protein
MVDAKNQKSGVRAKSEERKGGKFNTKRYSYST